MRRSGVEPNGQDREVGPPSFLSRGVEVLIGGCGMCKEEMYGCKRMSTVC